MGNEKSKSQVNHNGDQQVKIINMQGEHSVKLDNHEFMLWIILAVVIVHLVITLVIQLNHYFNKKAFKKAKSIIALNDITIEK
jgi:hypothetical protein